MAMDRDANCAVQRTTELELDRKAARLEGIPRGRCAASSIGRSAHMQDATPTPRK
ncbi:hypothetical protein OsI_10278 [Oryza sativa Indica Group]|uniref:Uncharacterized protein n=2 Tax=Oryza sativa TaxID=4530 RepID=B9F5J4_ORYSJ|nr:hypothetical protein OsI_10278 [Oryza sativa Indica Group]EEE58448.1 hypothetical protein OsJ_09675 [Oryza sativa Japonica Group]